jgi:hypothetical protein
VLLTDPQAPVRPMRLAPALPPEPLAHADLLFEELVCAAAPAAADRSTRDPLRSMGSLVGALGVLTFPIPVLSVLAVVLGLGALLPRGRAAGSSGLAGLGLGLMGIALFVALVLGTGAAPHA